MGSEWCICRSGYERVIDVTGRRGRREDLGQLGSLYDFVREFALATSAQVRREYSRLFNHFDLPVRVQRKHESDCREEE